MPKSAADAKTVLTPTEAILESISDGVFTVDRQWRVTSFNRAAEQITGVDRREAIGRLCSEVLRADMCGDSCALRQTLETGRPVIGRTGWFIDADGNRVPISLSTAVLRDSDGQVIGGAEVFRDLSEIEALRQQLDGKSRVGDLVSRSPLMQRLFEVLPAIAASPSTVLILGATGTGKEVMARTIHSLSPRSRGPFVAVNCAALPETLLFGYKAGAFTDARTDKPRRFALAAKGTIFLDEIGEMSAALQVKLLRVLQERCYEPLGSVASVPADARVIAATNRDLAALVRSGRFREDLYYRVNVVRIELPPLRRRKEDIPPLVDRFIDRFNQLQGKAIDALGPEALALLMAHDWPGNIRELENVIERAFILCGDGPITMAHLPRELLLRDHLSQRTGDLRAVRDLLDAQTIRAALRENNNNRLATARQLGVHKTTLFRRMKKLGLTAPGRRGRPTNKER